MDSLIASGGTVSGTVEVPGDKSISHRAAILAALANGRGHITNFLDAADTNGLLTALAAIGVGVERASRTEVFVSGRGNLRWSDPGKPLDLGNSGTALRLLAGVLSGRGVSCVLTGDASLRRRPMARIVAPLRAMGARIAAREDTPPLTLAGAPLHGTSHRIPVASAQVVSCLLLAGLHADGTTWIEAPPGARDHTERLLDHYGIRVSRDGARLGVERVDWDAVAAKVVRVPGDPSAAAFFASAAALVPGAGVTLPGVCANPTRIGFVDVLRRMGAACDWSRPRSEGGEPVADLTVTGGRLRATRIEPVEIPALVDELPILAVVAACAQGTTRITGAGELRHKESDRLTTMGDALRILGVRVHDLPDGLIIEGGALRGGKVDAAFDHRVAMAMAVASLRAAGPVVVERAAGIPTSFPDFVAVAHRAGMEIETR